MNKIIEQYNQEVVKKGAKRLPEEIVFISIMEQFGWTRDELMNIPNYILETIIEKNNIDFKLSKQK